MSKRQNSFSLDAPWAICEENYSEILQALSNKEIERIIEFGSGISTIRMYKDFPAAKVVSIEHHEKFQRKTVELLREYQVENAVVLHCPLKRVRIAIRSYLTYDLNIDQLERDIDFVLIDGPVEAETLRGREAPLYMVFPLLKIGGLVVLHDYRRNSAKVVVKSWLNSYNKNLKVVQKYNRLILVRKCGEQSQPSYPGIHSIIDNLCTNLRLCTKSLKKSIRSMISSWLKL